MDLVIIAENGLQGSSVWVSECVCEWEWVNEWASQPAIQ